MNEVKAAKHLGQHFLRDETVIARLLAVINAQADERILEIGPGLGALTLPLLRQTGALTAVEYDPRVLAPLAKKAAPLGTLHLIHADILDIDFGNMLPPPVGNWNSSSEGRESWGGGSKQPASATRTPPSPRGGGGCT
ncbi:MAG: rRNA adenine N-6-methyltransferase family protein, partial [Cardiobacterium sp.]